MLAHEASGEGPALTLLHGFMQTRQSWDEVRHLLPPGRRVVAVDLPGHGASVDADATMAAAAADLGAVWDHLGVATTDLVGYSLGGRVALFTAAQHPQRVRSLLTIGAHAGFEDAARTERRRADAVLADRVERDGIDSFATYWAAQPLFAGLARRGPAFLAALDAMRRAQDPAGVARSLRGMGGAAVEPFWDRLGAIEAPCTFVAGAEDARYVEAAARLASSVPDGRAVVVPDAGHAVHLEQPRAFVDVLLAHLEAHAPTR